MIKNYGFSICGKSHINRDIICQDTHKVAQLDNGWYIAAVADGVGSARYSDIGSRLAVDSVVDFCCEYMPDNESTVCIKSMLRTAYNYAIKRIRKEAERKDRSIEDYDTTLTTVIYDGKRIIYAHSGDGGIIVLDKAGKYYELTKPLKGADGTSVLPLRAGYKTWVIDSYDNSLASVVLVTDGMLDILKPYLLRGEPESQLYIPLCSYFADPIGLTSGDYEAINKFAVADDKYLDEEFYKRLALIYHNRTEKSDEIVATVKDNNTPVKLMKNLQDDKTLVCLFNDGEPIDNAVQEYYQEPNWVSLKNKWNKKAYPHLFSVYSVVENGEIIPSEKKRSKVITAVINLVKRKNDSK